MKPPTIHYAGSLCWNTRDSTITISSGFAACCSGQRAERIADRGEHTWRPCDVTCGQCLRQMARGGVIAERKAV